MYHNVCWDVNCHVLDLIDSGSNENVNLHTYKGRWPSLLEFVRKTTQKRGKIFNRYEKKGGERQR